MELQHLRYAVAVAETLSFTRAAQRCHVVQSALSQQVARLERELGARLFDRSSRGVRLTPAGEAFLPAARQSIEAAERARDSVTAVTGEVRGRLAVGAVVTTSVDVVGLLDAFRSRHPGVRIGVRGDTSDEQAALVRRRELDVGFLGVVPGTAYDGVLGLDLVHDRLVAACAPDHPLAARPQVTLERLALESLIDFPPGSGARAQSDQAFARHGIEREVTFDVAALGFWHGLVRRGMGVGLIPGRFAGTLAGVVAVPVVDAPERVERVVWAPQPSPAARAFLSLLGVDVDVAGSVTSAAPLG